MQRLVWKLKSERVEEPRIPPHRQRPVASANGAARPRGRRSLNEAAHKLQR
jgi:hypothetical protein